MLATSSSRRMRPFGRRTAVTLIELLVVIAVVAALIGLLLPAVIRARSRANRLTCSNNLRQLALALQSYHGAFPSFPPGVSYEGGKSPYPFMSWITRVLPFAERQDLWDQATAAFASSSRFLDNPPHVGLGVVLPLVGCPSDSRTLRPRTLGRIQVAFTAFLGVEGIDTARKDGMLYLDSRTRIADVLDGTSNTLLVGERPPSADGVLGWWYAGEGQAKDGSGDMLLGVREKNRTTYGRGCDIGPYRFGPGRIDNQCDAFHYWSQHADGANFAFCDGSVRFLAYSADGIMPSLATRAGGESTINPD